MQIPCLSFVSWLYLWHFFLSYKSFLCSHIYHSLIASGLWIIKELFLFLRYKEIYPCFLLCLVTRLGPTLCHPMDCSLLGSSVHGDSPDKNTGVGCHAFLQGIFPTQGMFSSSTFIYYVYTCMYIYTHMYVYICGKCKTYRSWENNMMNFLSFRSFSLSFCINNYQFMVIDLIFILAIGFLSQPLRFLLLPAV